jgi:histidinol dehydrogenase
VSSLDEAYRFASEYATEHLELHTSENEVALGKISNAGAIFVGSNSPVSLGDYMAGSNHVLPTGQQAKYGSGLGVHTFLRAQQIIDYNDVALGEIGEAVNLFAQSEGLPAHGEAILARLGKK